MSRVAKKPIDIPQGIDINVSGNLVTIKSNKGTLQYSLNENILIEQTGKVLIFKAKDARNDARAHAGTARAIVNNMVVGLKTGFEKKLILIGVGYRAQAQNRILNLTLGYSHPVQFSIPDGITIETPSQTEIVVKGIDKQKVGQVSATIRRFRAPEPYKGKGIRYADETIVLKEAKKK